MDEHSLLTLMNENRNSNIWTSDMNMWNMWNMWNLWTSRTMRLLRNNKAGGQAVR